ncbi:hypothetical protein SAMN05421868_15112 [Paenibacillus naphthalenovorans]|nr:hypothetical protein SAMN05421868_15112 [Paenibacillus naphthalenovorans]
MGSMVINERFWVGLESDALKPESVMPPVVKTQFRKK